MSERVLCLRDDEVSWAPTDDGSVVVLDLRTSKYLSLNASGSVLWNELARGVTVDNLARVLVNRFALEENVAEAHVAEFLQTLRTRELVTER